MKRVISIALVFALCLSLSACGKSQAAKECEELIAAIGEVSIDSKDAIEAAERAYSALNADEKDSISASGAILNDALDAYYLECCKLIFTTLNDAHEIVSCFGDDLYAMGTATQNGFNFGDEKFYFLKYMLSKISIHLTEDEMKQGIEAAVEGHNQLDGCDADICIFVTHTRTKYGSTNYLGELCVLGVSNAYKIKGAVTEVRDTLYKASVMMTGIKGVDSCAQCYLVLEKYYEAIEEYMDICVDYDDITQISNFGIMRDSYLGYSETYRNDVEALLAN